MTRVPMAHPRGEEARFQEGLAAGRIDIVVCEDCESAIWYPRTVCPECLSPRVRWTSATGRGTVHTLTTLHRAGHADRAADVPYTVALVDLDEGVRIIGDLADGIPIGARVVARVASDGLLFEAEADPS